MYGGKIWSGWKCIFKFFWWKRKMKLTGKLIKLIVLIVIAALVLIVAGAYFFGERAVEAAIETRATQALNVGVKVGDVDISVFAGEMGINGLTVNNPAGYSKDHLL